MTIVEICNSALVKIGAKTILSIDDDTKEANLCKVRIFPVRRIVLRMHPWNCAIDRQKLAPTTTAPVYGYSYAFNLPGGNLRLLEVADDIPYRLEGKRILCDATAINVKYINDVEDFTALDELVCEAIACYLAWDTAFALTQSNTAREFAWKQFMTVVRQAKSVDAQEERDHVLEANTLVDSRIQGVQ